MSELTQTSEQSIAAVAQVAKDNTVTHVLVDTFRRLIKKPLGLMGLILVSTIVLSALFASVIATNLQSLGYLLEHFLPKVTDGGQVVFVSSSATLLPFPRAEAYGASKAGIDYLAKTLRLDLKSENIDVTLIHPGFIKTPLTDKNDFPMPFLLSSQQAASRIYQGVSARKSYLHFPKRLTLTLKLLALFPDFVWQSIILRSNKV